MLLAQGGGLVQLLPAFLLIAALFYFMMYLPQKRQQQARRQMLAGLKKNDHVVTIGGIHGTIVALRKEGDRVTLKLDESSNMRVDFEISAIARVQSDEPGEEKSS